MRVPIRFTVSTIDYNSMCYSLWSTWWVFNYSFHLLTLHSTYMYWKQFIYALIPNFSLHTNVGLTQI